MRIALAQINPTLANFEANGKKILEFTLRAKEKRADLVVFPELSLFGYPPQDALENATLVHSQEKVLNRILKKLPRDITVIFGAVMKNTKAHKHGGKPFLNVAVVARRGAKTLFAPKQFLPTYDVFDEARFFEPAEKTLVVTIPCVGRVAVTVCEDMWCNIKEEGALMYKRNPLAGLKNLDLIVNISSSPYSKQKMKSRLETARFQVKKCRSPLVYVNQVGGQDELLFDGRSFILDKKGKLVVQATDSEEDLVISDMQTGRSEYRPTETNHFEVLRRVLVCGIRDFVTKTGQKTIHLGLSGGIDSALVASLAVDALGPARVIGLLLPGPYSSEGSLKDARALAKNLGIKSVEVNVTSLYEECLKKIAPFERLDQKKMTQDTKVDLVEQNLQARLRGLILMAYSNSESSMLVSTANKSELAVGYSTLYGDTNGGLMPIGDLVKGDVYALARLYNMGREIIPQATIDKAPSAELAPNQKDQDTLPAYDILDEAVINVVEKRKVPKNDVEKWVAEQVLKSEFKRWQAPPILRVTEHSFGRGRRKPIAFVKNQS